MGLFGFLINIIWSLLMIALVFFGACLVGAAIVYFITGLFNTPIPLYVTLIFGGVVVIHYVGKLFEHFFKKLS